MSGNVFGDVSGEHHGDVGRGRPDQASPAMSTDMKESPAFFFNHKTLDSIGTQHSHLDL